LNPWLTVGLSTIVNGVPLILIQRSADHPRNRYIVGASLTLFYYLLLGLGAGGFDTRYYVFVSLGFLGFYRDWRLLIAVGGLSLAAECIYDALVCSPEDGVSLADLNRFVSFGIWVAIECGVLVMLSQGSNRVFRSIGMIRAQLELERENDHRQLLERTRQLELTNEQYRALLESTSAVPWELDDGTGACRYIGAQVERQWGWAPECFQQDSFLFGCVHPDDRPAFAQALEETVAFQDVTVECRLRLKSDKYAHVRSIMRHAPGDKGRLVRGISFDITTQKKLESELYQAQKLESVGRLAAGVAHEINTPVQFVNDNCYFLRDAVAQIGEVVRVYRDALAAVAAGEVTLEEARERVAAAEESADYSFLSENMPTAVERALEGLERVAVIVRSMKEFSHPNQGAMSSSDINAAIRSTLTVARHEYKYVADIETRLGELPPVICNIGEFNQTFLNILVNAAHAIESVVAGTEKRGLITISTRHEGDSVLISIQDTGGGIPESVQESIFDPFFTTKEVGKGTGQGLAIARSVIVDKHHGSLNFETVPGVGTTFLIRMPLDGMGDEAIAA
jgi:signal transduction histidine kinase